MLTIMSTLNTLYKPTDAIIGVAKLTSSKIADYCSAYGASVNGVIQYYWRTGSTVYDEVYSPLRQYNTI